jgi:hypothetical protein
MTEKTIETTDEVITTSKDCLAYPEEISKEFGWTPEADMLLQISESIQTMNENVVKLCEIQSGILTFLGQAGEAIAAYIEKSSESV